MQKCVTQSVFNQTLLCAAGSTPTPLNSNVVATSAAVMSAGKVAGASRQIHPASLALQTTINENYCDFCKALNVTHVLFIIIIIIIIIRVFVVVQLNTPP